MKINRNNLMKIGGVLHAYYTITMHNRQVIKHAISFDGKAWVSEIPSLYHGGDVIDVIIRYHKGGLIAFVATDEGEDKGDSLLVYKSTDGTNWRLTDLQFDDGYFDIWKITRMEVKETRKEFEITLSGYDYDTWKVTTTFQLLKDFINKNKEKHNVE